MTDQNKDHQDHQDHQDQQDQQDQELPQGVHKDADGKFHTETDAREEEMRKRIEELRKRDPFVYK